jgi:hypothetical protein
MTSISRRHFLPLAALFPIVPAMGVRGERAETTTLLPGVYIYENDFDNPCEIFAAGDSLAFRNEKGSCSRGSLRSPTRVEVIAGVGWSNIGGTVTADGGSIKWDNNCTWWKLTRSDEWIYENDFEHPCKILEAADFLAFRNENGDWSRGTLLSPTRVEAFAGEGWCRLQGTLVSRDVIRWDNNCTWRRIIRPD